MLGLVNDWVGLVLQWVRLQRRNPFKVTRRHGEMGFGEDLVELDSGGFFFRKMEHLVDELWQLKKLRYFWGIEDLMWTECGDDHNPSVY